MGNDDSIIQAAQVSVTGENEADITQKRKEGLINYLMREHHGSPFEHNSMTFYVKAPIFVFREFQRHRIASYNEMSGRYTTLPAEFYIPNELRPLVNIGSSAKPEFAPGTPEQYELMVDSLMEVYELAWEKYKLQLDAGVANEVARMVLPVGIMSQMYVTMNLRGLFNFLSLRTKDKPEAAFVSRPQHEISVVADRIEEYVAQVFPIAHTAFNANGRVAP